MIEIETLNVKPFGFIGIEKKFQKIFAQNYHPSWMFVGRRGIGKSLVASRLALYVINDCDINWESKLLKSRVNKKFSEELIYVSPLSSSKSEMISKEQIDKILIKFNSFSSTGSWRAIIIDKLNLLSSGAMHAMLKVIEEPPERVIFFLIVDDISKVIPTIKSRCQMLFFNNLDEETCYNILKRKLPNLSDEELKVLVILSENSPGLAIELFNLSANDIYSEILNSIFDKTKINNVAEKIYKSSKNSLESSRLARVLIKRLTYILSMYEIKNLKQNNDFILNEFELVNKLKNKFSTLKILDILNDFNKRFKRINNYNTNSSLEIYQVLSKLN